MAALTLIILALSFVFTTAVPVINRHPNGNGNITVTDGANLRLRCEATGNGTLTYQWRRVSGSFPDSTEVRNNGQILFIGSITITDGGQYYCVVSDNDGSVSSMRVLVTVNRLPMVSISRNQQLSIFSGNEYVVLTCTALGDDIMGVYWERVNDQPLPTQNNMSSLSRDDTRTITLKLNITRARPIHSGRYHCIAYSEIGTVQSKRVTVTIKIAPPIIMIHSTNVTVQALQDATFTCEASGFEVKYEWKRHDNNNIIGNRSSLTISRATLLDEDQYFCVAMTEGGYAFSNNVTLTVNVTDDISIKIRMHPKGVTVSEGDSVVLNIDARGPGRSSFTYEWKKVGSDSLPNTASGGNLTKLTITSVTSSDSGLYYCIVINQWGNMVKSNNATVNVLYVTAHPQDVIVGVGKNVILTCNASGADNLKYQWMRMGNKTIPSTARGVNSNILVIPSIRVDDSGLYKCIVSSGDVNVMSEYGIVSVLNITAHPKDTVVGMGRNVTLTCNASGADNLKYQWMRMGNKTIPPTATGVNSNTLVIPNVTVDDSGQYKCVVSSDDIEVISEYGTVSVLELTVIIMDNSNKKDITVAEGSNVTLRCEAVGNVTMNYEWNRESKLSLRMNVIGTNTENLTIYNIKVQNSGRYYCEVEIGTDKIPSASVQVTARKKPSITNNPSNEQMSIVSGNEQVTLTCKVTGDDITGGYWERVNDDLLPVNNNRSRFNNKRTLSITIRRARPTHSGMYRCVVYSQWGVAQSRNVQVTITIAPPMITRQPTNQMITALQDVTFTCEAKGFEVEYEWKCHSGSVTGGRQSNLTISEAIPSDEDQYYCVAMTEGGYAFSNNVTLTVNVAPPTITKQPIDVMIQALENAMFTCEASGFEVKYEWKRHDNSNIIGNQPSLTISEATPLDEDQYYCVAITEGGYALSNNVTLTVNENLRISMHPNDITVSEGDTVVLSTAAEGTRKGLFTYKWKKVGSDSLRDTARGGNSAELTITSVTSSDSGLYYCIVMNQWGTMVKSNNATVNVLYIKTNPQDVIIAVDGNVTLTCNASGANNLKYQWMRMGNKTIPSTATGVNSNTLVIHSITVDDSGQYKCVVSSGDVNVMSEYGTVSVSKLTVIIMDNNNNRDITIAEGSNVMLRCEATGNVTMNYQWRRESKLFPKMNVMGRNTQNLTIYNIKVQNSGKYYCEADIGAKTIRSASVQVTARKKPSITNNPSNEQMSIVSGNEQVTLTCKVTGDNITGGYWERVNDDLLPVNNNRSRFNNKRTLTITIRRARPTHSGMYRCVVYSQWGVAQSRNVQVTITIAPPMITRQPTNQMITALQDVTFTCEAKGFDVEYEWKRHSGNVTGGRQSNLTISDTTPSDEDQYYCVAMTEGGYAFSNNVTLIVNDGIKIRMHPGDVTVGDGGKVVLSIDARGPGRKSFTYEWKKVGSDSLPDTASGGNSTAELAITLVTSSDSGLYYCIVINKWGNMVKSNNATVNVLYITAHPKDTIVGVGRDVTLTCNASGADNLKYQWMRMGNKTIPSTATGVNSNTLVIPSIRVDDSGQYKCVVSSGDVNVTSEYAMVSVLIITNNPDDVLAAVGTTVTLTCNASGTDNLKYQWMRKGNEPIISQAMGANTNSLTINNVTVDDSGKYKCAVSSGNATVVSKCGALSVVELNLMRPRGITFLTFTWSIPTSCYGRAFTVHFMQSDQSLMRDVTNYNGTYTLDNLSPYTDYSVHVVVGSTPGSTGRPLESVTSMTVNTTTLAGEPLVMFTQINQPEMIINNNSFMGTTHKVNLPVIDDANGPFSHLYIVVIDSNIIMNTKRMIINVQDITTAELIEGSKNPSSSYYVAAVVNASQYIPNHAMSFILGAGDNTTDPDGNVFHNRELERDVSYFFRIFSIDSSSEIDISTTTQPQSIPIAEEPEESNGSSSNSGSVVGPIVGVLLTLALLIAIILVIIFFLMYYKKKYLKSDSEQKTTPISSVNTTALSEKFSEPEKKTEEPPVLLATQADEPAIQETSFLESTEVKTSVGQPTTLVIGLPDNRIPEVTWKKDAEPVNHPVLPDGSLYIINTDHTDEGEYTVIINRKESTAFENLQLTVLNPQLPKVEKPGHGVIKVDDFTEHVALLKAEKDAKLQEEFELLDVQAPFTLHAAKLLCNKTKNRYKNIIPYDHSRVVLSQQDQITGSDYINASYIDGYGETRAYIAAQGPMKNTIDDFWRMVWEQNVVTIVMLTRLVEDAKAKCQQYWPGKGSRVCGNIKVTLHKEEQLANYAIRQFFVEQVAGAKNEIRLIYHFHFTAWPDHGVPKYAIPLLEFHKKVDKQHKRKNNKPMLVHCSAGVGRTGTFIAIDVEIQHLKKQNVLDVYDSVRKMRFWRNFMVQTISQYTFIHNALLEHIACGDTSIAAPVNNVEEKISELSKSNSETNKTGFQTQFEKLTRNSPKQSDFMYVAAISPKNKNKNRCQKLLPPDTARVIIPQLDGNSDYINFCFIDDYRQVKAFLAGPGPMQSTAVDFWMMIWEKKSHAVVMLGQLKENGEEVCSKYWPDENRTAEFGKFLVETITEDAWDKDIVKRTFKLTNTKREDDARTITQLQYVEWSQDTCPNDSTLIIDMIEVLERVQRKTGNGPITVHCSDGVGRSGTFCALMVSINRFKAEQMVDVFRTIITMRAQRPGVVANADQFEFIHQGLITMIKRFSPYSNFTDGTAV